MPSEQVMEAIADALHDQHAMCALFQSGSFDNKADASAMTMNAALQLATANIAPSRYKRKVTDHIELPILA